MTEVVRMGSREADLNRVELTAQPNHITAGGIVLLVATTDLARDIDYDVTWTIEGPVVLSDQERRIALLGATTVTGNQVRFTKGGPHEVRATLDTSELDAGAWTVGIMFSQNTGTSDQLDYPAVTDPPIRVV
jgi:hypothetical protein